MLRPVPAAPAPFTPPSPCRKSAGVALFAALALLFCIGLAVASWAPATVAAVISAGGVRGAP